MQRVVVLVGGLALASLACALPAVSPTPTATARAPDGGHDPLADSLTAAASASTTASLPATPDSPSLLQATPVTTLSTATTSQTSGEVTVVTISNTTRYALLGRSVPEVDAYMRAFGPPDSTGTRWFALTRPSFNWNYPCTCTDGACITGPVTVYVTLDYTLPTWSPSPEADPQLASYWSGFESAVIRHEREHGNLASACGLELGKAFVALGPQASCADVDAAVNAVSSPVFSECRAAQSDYETRTNHGQLDGVLWPPY